MPYGTSLERLGRNRRERPAREEGTRESTEGPAWKHAPDGGAADDSNHRRASVPTTGEKACEITALFATFGQGSGGAGSHHEIRETSPTGEESASRGWRSTGAQPNFPRDRATRGIASCVDPWAAVMRTSDRGRDKLSTASDRSLSCVRATVRSGREAEAGSGLILRGQGRFSFVDLGGTGEVAHAYVWYFVC